MKQKISCLWQTVFISMVMSSEKKFNFDVYIVRGVRYVNSIHCVNVNSVLAP